MMIDQVSRVDGLSAFSDRADDGARVTLAIRAMMSIKVMGAQLP
jgi:hypothetical protein